MSLRERKKIVNYSNTRRNKRKKKPETKEKEIQKILVEHGLSDDEVINEINQSTASLHLHLEDEDVKKVEPDNADEKNESLEEKSDDEFEKEEDFLGDNNEICIFLEQKKS